MDGIEKVKSSPFKYVGRVGVWLHSFVITALSTCRFTPGAVGIEVWVGPRVGLDVFAPTIVCMYSVLKRLAIPSHFHIPLPSVVPFTHS